MLSRAIATAVIAHYAAAKRDLPWRRTRDPYAIWVSEIMLQQTRVATVIPYWNRWMAKFPTAPALAGASLDDVLAAWSGLGYYSRARNLWNGARAIRDLPRTASELRAVPGIGRYTAGAIASIAFGERAPVVDGNVARVLARLYAIDDDIKSAAGANAAWRYAGQLMAALPETADPGDLNQGLIELGATLCSPTAPRCPACPLVAGCVAARSDRVDEFPVTSRRKRRDELPILDRTLVWVGDACGIVLARRRAGGLFGGLWELPPRELAEQLGIAIGSEPVAYHDQTLSHRRLRIAVVCGGMPARLVDPRDPGYDAVARVALVDVPRLGIAAATTAILCKYENDPWSSIPLPSPCSPRATRKSSKGSATSATTSPMRTSPKPRLGRRRASTSSSTTSAKLSSK